MASASRIAIALTIVLAAAAAVLFLTTRSARAQDNVAVAKEQFTRGVELTRQEKWGEALEAFEAAGRAKRHALTTYNVGVAERSLSRYTRARMRFQTALDEDAAAGGKELAQNFKDDAKMFLNELDALLVHVDVTLDPADAALMVDGRPLAWMTEERKVAYAGAAQAGAGETVNRARFELIVDPGMHVFTVTKEGFETVAKREELKASARAALLLSLTAMPGKIKVDANQGGAVVRVDDVDVGLAPIMLERPAGTHHVDVRKSGYVSYNTSVNVKPGQQADLFAPLKAEVPLTKRWWFWTAAGVVVVGALATVWLAVVLNPSDYYGGTTGWVAKPQ